MPTTTEEKNNVGMIFTKVSPYYDAMNDILSLGLHRIWKKNFVESIPISSGDILVDLSCGTGDLIQIFLDKQLPITIHAVDPNPNMLTHCKTKIARQNACRIDHPSKINYHVAAAEQLDCLETDSVDIMTCAFGLRNFADREKGLTEVFRVLKPQGSGYFLEFGQTAGPIKPFYNFYRDYCIPGLGYIFKDRDSYEYLSTSIRNFWSDDEIKIKFQNAGFTDITLENICGTIVKQIKFKKS